MLCFWKIVLLVVVVLVVVFIGMCMFGGGKFKGEVGKFVVVVGWGGGEECNVGLVLVMVVEVVCQDVLVYVSVLGMVVVMNIVIVSLQVGGQLISLNFKEGQEVKKGDLLVQIDLCILQVSYDEVVVVKCQNQVQLVIVCLNFQCFNLFEYCQYVVKIDLDIQCNQVVQYESVVVVNEVSMCVVQVQLQYICVIVLIFGIVGICVVDVGNVVSVGIVLVILIQIYLIYVVFNLFECQLFDVCQVQQVGLVMIVVLDCNDLYVFIDGGRLDVVDNQISSDSGIFCVCVVFDNVDNLLWLGQFVNVWMQLCIIVGGVVIFIQVVMCGLDGEYVYIVKLDNIVVMQMVKSGVEVGDSNVQIIEGFKGGECVVSEGQFWFKFGSKVIVFKLGEILVLLIDVEFKVVVQQQGGGGCCGGGLC